MANWQVISLDTTTPQLRAPGTGDGYSFNSGSTQLGVWTTTGLGVGTASPSQRLEVNGNIAVGGSLGTTPSLNRGIYVQSNTNNDVVGYSLYVNDGANNRRGSMFLDDATGLWGWDVTSSSGTPSYVWRVAAAEVMRLNDSGNLGIGTTNPQYRFHVVGATASVSAFKRTTADDTQILVGNTAGDLQIRALANGNSLIFSDTGKTLGFGSNGSGTAQLTLDTSGNLGIGTASPSNTAGFSRQVQIEGTTAALTLSGTTGTGKYTLGVPGVNAIGLWDNTASAYRWYVDSSGSVGIGTTNPITRLQVNAAAPTIRIEETTTGGFKRLEMGVTSSGLAFISAPQSAQDLTFNTTGTERARITSSGNLLLGTTTAAYSGTLLNIGTTSDSQNGVQIQTSTTGIGYLLFGDGSGANAFRGEINYAHTSDSMAFKTAGTERASISSTGNVVVNTAAVATTATDGFLYIPTCAGAPTGVPTTFTGRSPLVVDSTNNRFYVYVNGAWKYATLT